MDVAALQHFFMAHKQTQFGRNGYFRFSNARLIAFRGPFFRIYSLEEIISQTDNTYVFEDKMSKY